MVFADIRPFVTLAGVGSPSARASFSVSVSSSEVHCRWGMCSHCWRVPHTQGDCTLLVPGKTWEGLDGMGQVEELFVAPAHRGRGLARALLHHAIADCRAHGADDVVLLADASDTPMRLYAAMGFAPVAVLPQYLHPG